MDNSLYTSLGHFAVGAKLFISDRQVARGIVQPTLHSISNIHVVLICDSASRHQLCRQALQVLSDHSSFQPLHQTLLDPEDRAIVSPVVDLGTVHPDIPPVVSTTALALVHPAIQSVFPEVDVGSLDAVPVVPVAEDAVLGYAIPNDRVRETSVSDAAVVSEAVAVPDVPVVAAVSLSEPEETVHPDNPETASPVNAGVPAEDLIATEICTSIPPSGVVNGGDNVVVDSHVLADEVPSADDVMVLEVVPASHDQAIPLQVYVLAKEGHNRWQYCLEVYGPDWFPPMKHIMCTGTSMTVSQVYILVIGHASFLLSRTNLLPKECFWELHLHFPGPHIHRGNLVHLISWWHNPEIALCPGNSTPTGATLSLINRLKGLNSFQETNWIRLSSQKVSPFFTSTRGTEGLWHFNRYFGFGRSDSVQLLGDDPRFTAYQLDKGNGFHNQFNKPIAHGGWAILSDVSWSSSRLPSTENSSLQDLWPKIVKLRMLGLSTVRKFGSRQSRLLNQSWLELFSSIAKASTNETWLRLLCFAPLVLFAKQNIGLRLHLWKNQQYGALFDLAKRHLHLILRSRASQNDFDNISRCELQISIGRYSAAWSNLGSDGAISSPDKNLYEALQDLHPAETSPPPSLPPSMPVMLDSQEVTTAVWRTKSGSAPGISGLRIDHIKGCFFAKGFSKVFTEVLNLLVAGQIPAWASSVFAGAKLIALQKPSGGVRPIALTESIRRLASKSICLKHKEHFGELVGPHQYGVGVSSGIEKAVGYSRFCWRKSGSEVMLQIDAKNAFNCVHRSAFFEALKTSDNPVLTSITSYISQMYGDHSVLHNNLGDPILAQRGVAQGDNLSPFLFALAIKPVLTSIAELGVDIISFLDDITLIGSVDNVCRAWQSIQVLLAEIGLSVNHRYNTATCFFISAGAGSLNIYSVACLRNIWTCS
jgi:hypothetical protein